MTQMFENFKQIETFLFDVILLIVVKIVPLRLLKHYVYLKVKVQGSKYYVTEECNIWVGVWGKATAKFLKPF